MIIWYNKVPICRNMIDFEVFCNDKKKNGSFKENISLYIRFANFDHSFDRI